ncbi:MAG: ABC transporter substrate-binding protein [Chloroflexota bacterium]
MRRVTFDRKLSGVISRREALRAIGLSAAAGLAVACAPSAPSASPPTGVDTVAANEPWYQEWRSLVAAAQQEGSLSIQTPLGTGFRRWLDTFQQAFPGIGVEHSPLRGSDFAARAKSEREAGIFSFDVAVSSPGSVGRILRPIGAFEPLTDAIFRTDVTDDSKWLGGYKSHFLDLEQRWYFGFGADIYPILFVNTDMVKDGEIASFKDILNPKWKGKILQKDPRTEGAGYISMSVIRQNLGAEADELIRRFYSEMDPAFGTDDRQNTEFMVRGRYAISFGGLNEDILNDFQQQGAGTNVKLLVFKELLAVDPADCLWNVSRAPHPSAGKLFINWCLSQEGQASWSRELDKNSGRIDVPAPKPDRMAPAETTYNFQAEVNDKAKIDTRDFIRTLLPR